MMLSNEDRTLIINNKTNRPGSIIIGYNNETTAHFMSYKKYMTDTGLVFHRINKRNYTTNTRRFPEWNKSPILCRFRFTESCGDVACDNYGEIICMNCHNYYINSRPITENEYDKYIMPQSYGFTFVMGFTKHNKYYISLNKHDDDGFTHHYFLSIGAIDFTQYIDPIPDGVYEYRRRKYIRRILMFAQTDLIKDVISEIAGLLISL